MNDMLIRFITALETYPLRHALLRPHQALTNVIFDGDEMVDTFHLGIYDAQRLIGIASLYKHRFILSPHSDSWQLRGMAILPEYQGKGYGCSLVQTALQKIANRGGEILWCNAREAAVKFYQSLAFKITSERFDIADIGPHYLMWREV